MTSNYKNDANKTVISSDHQNLVRRLICADELLNHGKFSSIELECGNDEDVKR